MGEEEGHEKPHPKGSKAGLKEIMEWPISVQVVFLRERSAYAEIQSCFIHPSAAHGRPGSMGRGKEFSGL